MISLVLVTGQAFDDVFTHVVVWCNLFLVDLGKEMISRTFFEVKSTSDTRKSISSSVINKALSNIQT